jgi:cytochrome c oxidase subunit 4
MGGIRPLFLVWAALLVLLAVSVAGSFVFTGPLNLLVSFGTAALKALMILWFYMHLREEDGLNRVFAVGAVVWLVILLLLPALDFVSR